MWGNARFDNHMQSIINEIKNLLKDVSCVTDKTRKDTCDISQISFWDNPLLPNLLSYCFDNILGFDVKYRIAEKVNYIIEFDYKGTYAVAKHFKMSYDILIDSKYKSEFLLILQQIRPLLENLFELIGEEALCNNNFSMKNEAIEYFDKLQYYQNKIEMLEQRRNTVQEKVYGQYDVTVTSKYTRHTPKCQKYLRSLYYEIEYNIESYIDTFFSALEHILTLLYPFTEQFSLSKSYYKDNIRSTKWHWSKKLDDVCGNKIPRDVYENLKRIKEIYRNHNAHGGFSREMMAYVQIPEFGRYPIYVGKEYLKGFIDNEDTSVSYDKYIEARDVFIKFWQILDTNFEIPMLFIKSGLAIPVDTTIYTKDICSVEQAKRFIDKTWFEIDNQANMDW